VFAIDKKEKMIALAAGSAILAGLLGWLFLRHLENTFQDGSQAISILVANRFLVPGTTLTPELFSSVTIPKAYAQPLVVADFAVLESSPGHPRFRNSIALPEGSQLVQTCMSPLFSEDGLSQIIPDGFMAVSFGVDNVRGLSGNIRPGDLINILHTPKVSPIPSANMPATGTLFQAVPVLAVGKKLAIADHPMASAVDKLPKDSSSEDVRDETTVITVSLNPLAAVRLAQIRENEALSVVLRPQGDNRIVEGIP
jgi:Flp pilus assembly protein CpaB